MAIHSCMAGHTHLDRSDCVAAMELKLADNVAMVTRREFLEARTSSSTTTAR